MFHNTFDSRPELYYYVAYDDDNTTDVPNLSAYITYNLALVALALQN